MFSEKKQGRKSILKFEEGTLIDMMNLNQWEFLHENACFKFHCSIWHLIIVLFDIDYSVSLLL